MKREKFFVLSRLMNGKIKGVEKRAVGVIGKTERIKNRKRETLKEDTVRTHGNEIPSGILREWNARTKNKSNSERPAKGTTKNESKIKRKGGKEARTMAKLILNCRINLNKT